MNVYRKNKSPDKTVQVLSNWNKQKIILFPNKITVATIFKKRIKEDAFELRYKSNSFWLEKYEFVFSKQKKINPVTNKLKKYFDFYLLKNTNGKWERIYSNSTKSNFSLSIKLFFINLKKIKDFQEESSIKNEESGKKALVVNDFVQNFNILIDKEQNDIDIYTNKSSLTIEELKWFLNKELENIKNIENSAKEAKVLSEEEIEINKLKIKELENILLEQKNAIKVNFDSNYSWKKTWKIYKRELEREIASNVKISKLLENIDKLNWLVKINKLQSLIEIKNKMLNYNKNLTELKEMPKDLYDLAVKDRGRMSKLEKVLVNKARELVIKIYTNNINFKNEWIQELKKRTFWRIDETKDKIIVTEQEAILYWVPLKKNLYKLIEVELKGRASWKILIDLEKLKKSLNWSEVDIISHIFSSMLESVYFFRPDLQEKKIEFDTFIISSIRKSIQDLKNYTIKVDKNWWRKERQKDNLIIDKIKKYKYELELENKEYTFENILEKCNYHNQNTTTFKISENDVKKFMNNLSTNYISFDDVLAADEGDMKNEYLQADLWNQTWEESSYNPVKGIEEEQMREGWKKAIWEIAKTIEEEIIWELWIEQFSNLKDWSSEIEINWIFKFPDLKKFNELYKSYPSSGRFKKNWKNSTTLTVEELQKLSLHLKDKILNNPDIIQKYIMEFNN